jgi:hypothetical protein
MRFLVGCAIALCALGAGVAPVPEVITPDGEIVGDNHLIHRQLKSCLRCHGPGGTSFRICYDDGTLYPKYFTTAGGLEVLWYWGSKNVESLTPADELARVKDGLDWLDKKASRARQLEKERLEK